jgi:hypothetical protein
VKNELLFAVGDEPDGLFAVLQREVHISQNSADGRHGLLLIASALARNSVWRQEIASLWPQKRQRDCDPCTLQGTQYRMWRR